MSFTEIKKLSETHFFSVKLSEMIHSENSPFPMISINDHGPSSAGLLFYFLFLQ